MTLEEIKTDVLKDFPIYERADVIDYWEEVCRRLIETNEIKVKEIAFDAWVARDQSNYNFEDWFKRRMVSYGKGI